MSSDPRSARDWGLLVGYGAAAVNPYLAMESAEDLAREGYYVTSEPEQAVANLVKALGKAFDKTGRRVPCFVQVDVGDEKQKGGCPVGELPALLKLAREADIPVRGLMCLPPADIEPAPFFALLGKLAMDHGLADLSMGMSGDYETAIMLGATHVRVGTALFGER